MAWVGTGLTGIGCCVWHVCPVVCWLFGARGLPGNMTFASTETSVNFEGYRFNWTLKV